MKRPDPSLVSGTLKDRHYTRYAMPGRSRGVYDQSAGGKVLQNWAEWGLNC